MLTVLSISDKNRSGNYRWHCVCDCGGTTILSRDHLTRKRQPVKSCGCLNRKSGPEHKDWKGFGEISGNWWCTHILRERRPGDRKRVPVTITIEEAWILFLKQERKCALSGVPLHIGRKGNASLDRIDSSKGYEPDNIQWVDKHINFMKRTYTVETFLYFCQKVTEHSKVSKNEA